MKAMKPIPSKIKSLTKALDAAQESYGAPATQRVRNAQPYWQLLVDLLPELIHPCEKIMIPPVTLEVSTVSGTVTIKNEHVRPLRMTAQELLTDEYYAQAPTFDDIIALLEKKGYLAVPGSVRVALHSLMQTETVVAYRANKRLHFFLPFER